ncbi:MAG TPA: peptide deformylase [Chloroflexota bacterium]|nr:peptide deformylase [Chloroflexota bacterium]
MPKFLPVRQDGDPVLRRKAKKASRVDDSLRRLIDDMFYTMYNNDTRGIGLAAPQVGVSIRVIVVDMQDDEHEPIALVNPEIVKASQELVCAAEGCLSVPGLRGDVERHEWVTVKARDDRGHETRIRADGWFARCLQHEIDHLDGILYTDKATDIREADEEAICAENAEREARGERVPVSI